MTSPTQIRWAAIAFFVMAAVVLFLLDSTGNGDQLIAFLRDPMAAVAAWAAPSADAVSQALERPVDIEQAQAEIAQLEARVAELERENEDLREIQGEFQLLRELFDYAKEQTQNERVLAGVIGYDTSPLFDSIVIDKGSDDGIRIGMPVDSPRGLVGQVFRVTADSALVLLVTDSSSSVPVRLSNSRATGVVHGGGLGSDMVMDWIPLEAEVEPGDVVLTSGLIGEFEQGLMVGRFPKGLVLGRVADVVRSDAEILQRATVQSAVDFSGLELVFVITAFPQEDITPFEDPLGQGN